MMDTARCLHWRVCLLAAATLILVGCGGKEAGEKVGEKAMAAAISKATGKKADVDLDKGKVTVTSGDNVMESTATEQWPSDLPGNPPEFTYGKVERVSRAAEGAQGPRTANVWFRDVSDDALARYEAGLKGAGWEAVNTMQMPKGGMVSAQKANFGLTLICNAEDKRGNLSVFTQSE